MTIFSKNAISCLFALSREAGSKDIPNSGHLVLAMSCAAYYQLRQKDCLVDGCAPPRPVFYAHLESRKNVYGADIN
jgi:hypothetical protein